MKVLLILLTIIGIITIAIGSFNSGFDIGYEAGKTEAMKQYEAGKTEAMKQIELSNGVTNMDSSIAKLKQMPSDSVAIAVFNLYATDQEREVVRQFAMWIKKVKKVK
jgi:hypothetical protein